MFGEEMSDLPSCLPSFSVATGPFYTALHHRPPLFRLMTLLKTLPKPEPLLDTQWGARARMMRMSATRLIGRGAPLRSARHSRSLSQ